MAAGILAFNQYGGGEYAGKGKARTNEHDYPESIDERLIDNLFKFYSELALHMLPILSPEDLLKNQQLLLQIYNYDESCTMCR